MKKYSILAAVTMLFVLPCGNANAQVDETLKQDIVETGFIHRPLPVREDKALETVGIAKKAVKSDLLCDMESLDGWTHEGYGTISLTTDRAVDGTHSLRLEAPAHPDKILGWGLGRGTCMARFNVGGKDWTGYNRLRFKIYPECEGARSTYIQMYFENDGEEKVPDQYGREGYHLVNLKNNQWNDCYVDFPVLSRDKITCVKFSIELFGQELAMSETVRFDIDNVLVETIENPELALGWIPSKNEIIFSTTGYKPQSVKTALITVEGAKKFQIKDAKSGAVVFNGDVNKEKTRFGEFNTIDFTEFETPGQYVIEVGEVKTWPFYIDENVWDDSVWRVLNFIFCERCGYPVPNHHGTCHNDFHAVYKGQVIPIHGGWHDAADMSQQFLQSGEISYSLFQMAQTAKKKGQLNLYNRLTEEALWGMDVVLRTRLGDGMRAVGWGTNLWTDGKVGTDDDSGRREIRVKDFAYENYLYAGIEAYAAMVYDEDKELVGKFRRSAIEDYGFAKARFEKLGFEELREARAGGHTSMTSESQYHASITWAASMLYKLTGEKKYAEDAAEAIKYVMACQRTEPVGGGLKGFFYRNTKRNTTVHFNHQSRDYAYMEAFQALIETQPEHPDFQKWMNSVKLYGEFLKESSKYIAPYGMLPSGVYNIHEEEADPVEFYAWQVGRKEKGGKDYQEMLKNGVKLDNEHYLRMFPVWYSFKGNTAVNLAAGKSAAICAKILKDKELMDIAEDQLRWVVGYNPFGQSLIYGEGSNYGKLYTALPGEMVGETPVGMQARFNGDEPYWPSINTATYKEVWGATAVKWFMLVSEF